MHFISSLKFFIDKEDDLPCRAGLQQALVTLALDKVKSDFLIFPQGNNQLVLTKLNKLFNLTEIEKVEKI